MNFAPLSAYLPLHVPADKLKICFYFFSSLFKIRWQQNRSARVLLNGVPTNSSIPLSLPHTARTTRNSNNASATAVMLEWNRKLFRIVPPNVLAFINSQYFNSVVVSYFSSSKSAQRDLARAVRANRHTKPSKI